MFAPRHQPPTQGTFPPPNALSTTPDLVDPSFPPLPPPEVTASTVTTTAATPPPAALPPEDHILVEVKALAEYHSGWEQDAVAEVMMRRKGEVSFPLLLSHASCNPRSGGWSLPTGVRSDRSNVCEKEMVGRRGGGGGHGMVWYACLGPMKW